MFRKIFITYLSILILIMLVLSVVVSSLASDYVYAEKKKTLEDLEKRVNAAANDYYSGSLDANSLGGIVDSLAYITNTKIYVLSGTANESIDLKGELSGQYIKDALITALDGGTVYARRQYSSDFDAQMIFAAYPWESDGIIHGAILLFSPEKEVASIISSITLAVWLIASAFVIFGGIIIYLFSLRIVRPIKSIEEASVMMAKGQYPDDLKVKTKDELGQLARSFNRMKYKLISNDRLRQDLIANISHDLRTPLTNINGYLAGMEEGIIKREDYTKYISTLRGETKRLINITGAMLEAAKIQAGSIELSRESIPLYCVAAEAVEANIESARNNGISIRTDIPTGLIVNADRVKLGLALYNIINNAVKYSKPEGTVTISARHESGGVNLTVSDDGIGIPEKDMPQIFERFYRAENSSASGYGLGLSIAKAYTEAHGGSITVESAQGEGTRVSVYIP